MTITELSPADSVDPPATFAPNDRPSPLRPWQDRVLLLVAFVVAGLPPLLAHRRATAQGWLPTGDDARILADSLTVFSAHPPLLGLASDSLELHSGISPVHHPGPFEAFVLGAVQKVAPGPGRVLLGALLIELAAVLVALLAARRLWGPGGLLVTAGCWSVVGSSLGTPILADIWNPTITILPLGAFVLSLWAYALARWRPGLPLALLLASFCMQTHLTDIPIVLAATLPVAILVVVGIRWRRLPVRPPPGGWLFVGGSVLAALVTWLPPLWLELTGRYSNVANLYEASMKRADEPAQGFGFATHVLGEVLGTPPPFGPVAITRTNWDLLLGVHTPSLLRVGLVVGLLVALAVLGFRRRDGSMLGAAVSTLVLVCVGTYLLSVTTWSLGGAVYHSRWVWALTLVLWPCLFAGAGRVLLPTWFGVNPAAGSIGAPQPGHDGSAADGETDDGAAHGDSGSPLVAGRGARRVWLGLGIGVIVLLAVAGPIWRMVDPGSPNGDILSDRRRQSETVGDLADQVMHRYPTGTRLAVEAEDGASPGGATGIALGAYLRASGYDVTMVSNRPEMQDMLGRGRADRGDPGRVVLRVAVRDWQPAGPRVASVRRLSADEREELARLRRRLARRLRSGDVRLRRSGDLLHLLGGGSAEALLKPGSLENALVGEALTGNLPSMRDARRYADLMRHVEVPYSLAVEARRRPDG